MFQFEVAHEMKLYTVYFNAISEKRNYLSAVVLDDHRLDLVDLQRTHKALYNKIYREIEEQAKGFWSTSNVPTYAYQAKKILGLAVILLLTSLFSCSPHYTIMQQKTVVTSVHPVKVIGITKLTPFEPKVGDTITMITKVKGGKKIPNNF